MSITRLQNLSQEYSLFLFGARGTGKSTLIHQDFKDEQCYWINLLEPEQEERFSSHPEELLNIVRALPDNITHVIIDEIQKIPKLLDIVHILIEEKKKIFVMTGSSARKLKYGGANLLAGRAFVYYLYPFSFVELKDTFNLNDALQWGLLPKIFSFNKDEDKSKFLQAYTYTYLKEEIWAEQFIKKLNPFRRFLEVAAQTNGKIINYANIARDVGVDDKTVKEYFSILEDSLIGFLLEPFQHSFRKRLSLKSKFYFFDVGVTRSLARILSLPLKASTSLYGETFEHFIILECMKLANYCQSEFRFSYLRTKDDVEIDLVIERPGQPILFIEIKSSKLIKIEDLSRFIKITKDFDNCEAVCLSQEPYPKMLEHVRVLPWKEGIKELFGGRYISGTSSSR